MMNVPPVIIAAAITSAAAIGAAAISKPEDIDIPAPPDPDEAKRKAEEEKKRVGQSREAFIGRQMGLGPIQLQAPTLKL